LGFFYKGVFAKKNVYNTSLSYANKILFNKLFLLLE